MSLPCITKTFHNTIEIEIYDKKLNDSIFCLNSTSLYNFLFIKNNYNRIIAILFYFAIYIHI